MAHAIDTQIAIVGTRYHNVADYGEAYSHAAAAVLGVPVMTHDLTAVRALKRAGEQISNRVRVFDAYALSHQRGDMSAKDCDEARKVLRGLKEWVPDVFCNRNFQDGLAGYYPRLCDSEMAGIGSPSPIELDDVRIALRKTVQI